MQANGMAMLFRSMGFDPEHLIAKGKELEAQGKLIAADVQLKVASIDARMDRMEAMILSLHNMVASQMEAQQRLESTLAGTQPAGETIEAELVEVAVLATTPITPKNGRKR